MRSESVLAIQIEVVCDGCETVGVDLSDNGALDGVYDEDWFAKQLWELGWTTTEDGGEICRGCTWSRAVFAAGTDEFREPEDELDAEAAKQPDPFGAEAAQ